MTKKRSRYPKVEEYMQSCMTDSAHDMEHVYRVLYYALDIAKYEDVPINVELLSTACLLHDIGRAEQYADSKIDHAICGAEKAHIWLLKNGYTEEFACAVKECIVTHRFRSNNPPKSIEAKILFDADKLDVCGAIGIARALYSKAIVGEPFYSISENGEILDGTNDTQPSFFHEFKFKLEKLYERFYTVRAKQLASERKTAAETFYSSMLSEVKECYSYFS